MISPTIFSFPEIFPKTVFGYIFLFLIVEWQGRKNNYALQQFGLHWHKLLRLGFYYLLAIIILYFYGKDFQFLYFQF